MCVPRGGRTGAGPGGAWASEQRQGGPTRLRGGVCVDTGRPHFSDFNIEYSNVFRPRLRAPRWGRGTRPHGTCVLNSRSRPSLHASSTVCSILPFKRYGDVSFLDSRTLSPPPEFDKTGFLAPAAYSHPRSCECTPTCVVTHPVWCVDPHAARCVHAFHAPHCRVFASMCASAAWRVRCVHTHPPACMHPTLSTRREPTECHAL